MRLVVALVALLAALPVSAATFDLNATWHSGDASWDRYSGFHDPRTLSITTAEAGAYRWSCGLSRDCSSFGRLALGDETIVGSHTTGSGALITWNVVQGHGTVSYLCDCVWYAEVGDTGGYDARSIRFSAEYTLQVSPVPLPASGVLLALSLVAFGRLARRRHA